MLREQGEGAKGFVERLRNIPTRIRIALGGLGMLASCEINGIQPREPDAASTCTLPDMIDAAQ